MNIRLQCFVGLAIGFSSVIHMAGAQNENSTQIKTIQDTNASSASTSTDSASLVLKNEESSAESLFVSPQLISASRAVYPPECILNGIGGTVLLTITIDENGSVDRVKIEEGCDSILDQNAARAAYDLTFEPILIDGEPVSVSMEWEYFFDPSMYIDSTIKLSHLDGQIREMGTRDPVPEAYVAIWPNEEHDDGDLKTNGTQNPDTTTGAYQENTMSKVLKIIGALDGYTYEEGKLIGKTDSVGRFSFKYVPIALCSVLVVCPGYHIYEEEEFLPEENGEDELDIRLERKRYNPYEIVVYGRDEPDLAKGYSLSAAEIAHVPGAGKDVLRALRTLPGITRASLSSSELIIRGTGEQNTRVFIDGFELPYLFHLPLTHPRSFCHADMIEALDYFPNGLGVKYGDAVGSVIQLNTRSASDERMHGIVDISETEASFFLESKPNPKLSFMASGTKSYYDKVFKAVYSRFTEEPLPYDVMPSYHDAFVKMDVAPSAGHSVSGFFILAKDTMKLTIRGGRNLGSAKKDPEMESFKFGKGLVSGNLIWKAEINEIIKNRAQYGIGFSHTSCSDRGYSKLRNETVYNFIRNELSMQPTSEIVLDWGIEATHKDNELFVAALTDTVWNDTVNVDLGPYGSYLNAQWYPWKDFTIGVGVRYDYYPSLSFDGGLLPEFWDMSKQIKTDFSVAAAAHVSAMVSPWKNHTARLSLGAHNQAPRIEDMSDLSIGRDMSNRTSLIDPQRGNPELPVTRGNQFTFGYDLRLTDRHTATIGAYVKNQWDIPRLPTQKDLVLDSEVSIFADGKAQQRGIELALKKERGERFWYGLTYTLGRSEVYDFTEQKMVLHRRDNMHNAQIYASVLFNNNMEFGARFQYTDGFPETPLLAVRYNATEMRYVPTLGEKNSQRTDSHFGIDLLFSKRFIMKNMIFTLRAELTNALHLLQFVEGSDGEPVYNPKELTDWYYDYSKGNPISVFPVPVVGLSCEF
ncbi:MAG: TonB-dependent receptor domain-containing protein [Chitinispirillaceae bacterium]